jgi:hypothetical protein
MTFVPVECVWEVVLTAVWVHAPVFCGLPPPTLTLPTLIGLAFSQGATISAISLKYLFG